MQLVMINQVVVSYDQAMARWYYSGYRCGRYWLAQLFVQQWMQRKKSIPAFIRNTYQMLQRQDLREIVSWLDLENGFVIKNLALFTNQVLPQYFKHKKYPSFVRQLNMYGFHKQRSKDNYHSYGHQFFKRGVLDNKDKLSFEAALKRKPEKKKKTSNDAISQIKNAKPETVRSCSSPQPFEQRSVSIQLEDEQESICFPNNRHQPPSHSLLHKRDCKQRHSQEDCGQGQQIGYHQGNQAGYHQDNQAEYGLRKEEYGLGKEAGYGQGKEAEYDEEQSSSVGQGKLERLVMGQNAILQAMHCTIRQQLLKCKQLAKNRALGYAQMLNKGTLSQCAGRLTALLNQQNLLLERLAISDNDDSPQHY